MCDTRNRMRDCWCDCCCGAVPWQVWRHTLGGVFVRNAAPNTRLKTLAAPSSHVVMAPAVKLGQVLVQQLSSHYPRHTRAPNAR